jgi:hypothetical protein
MENKLMKNYIYNNKRYIEKNRKEKNIIITFGKFKKLNLLLIVKKKN